MKMEANYFRMEISPRKGIMDGMMSHTIGNPLTGCISGSSQTSEEITMRGKTEKIYRDCTEQQLPTEKAIHTPSTSGN